MTHFDEVHKSIRIPQKFLFEHITNMNYYLIRPGGQVKKIFKNDEKDDPVLHSSINSYIQLMGIKLSMPIEFKFIGPCQTLAQLTVFGKTIKASINLIRLSKFKSRIIIPIYGEKTLFHKIICYAYAHMLTAAVISKIN